MLLQGSMIAVALIFSSGFLLPQVDASFLTNEKFVPCDSGWYNFHQKCYKLDGTVDKLPWDEAEQRCKSFGGHLVSIESQEENDFLNILVMVAKQHVWIGLNDRDKEGHYKWIDGTPSTYSNWRENEPWAPAVDVEDCIEMTFRPHFKRQEVGEWNDHHCTYKKAYICQKNIDKQKNSPNPLYCPGGNGGWKFRKSCYHLHIDSKSWQDAEQYCQRTYGGDHLAKILDRDVEMFIDYMLSDIIQEAWIGIKNTNQIQKQWSSGWYVSYERMEPGSYKDGECVIKRHGQLWNKEFCYKELPFICEGTKETPPILRPGVEGSHCPKEPEGWRDLGGELCYYIETGVALTWHESNTECITRGGHLLSLHSKEESDILHPFVKYTQLTIQIGLVRLQPPNDDVFVWTDGSIMDFENWDKPNQPDFRAGIEKCGEVSTDNMGWNDMDCNSKAGYICSVMKVIPNATTIKSVTRIADLTKQEVHLSPRTQHIVCYQEVRNQCSSAGLK